MKTATAFPRVARTTARQALWFCACNLLTAALSAQCTSVSQVPNGTISSGTPCYSNNDTLTAAGVTINGSAKVTFVAGKTIRLTPGFRATAPTGGAASTTFHAWVETAPSVTSVSPASGSLMTQTFTFTASSPSGFADISELQLLFNTTQTGADGCYIRYRANALYLADNSGTNWLGGFAPGSAGTASNSYCSISGSGASVSGSGTQLSVTVPVTFQSVFAGAKNTYAITYDDDAMNSGWQPMGTWTVPGTPVGPDFELTTSQNTWYVTTGPSTPTFNVDVKPLNGFTGPVSFTVQPFFYCYSPAFNPASVSAPSWRTTLSMTCNEPNVNHTYWATVTATGGGKTHQLGLYLYITATQQYLLTTNVNPPGAGSITPSGWYNAGAQIAVTATPAVGYQFTGFSGSLTGGSPGYIIMNSNKSVTANFVQQQPSTVTHTITTSPVTGLLLTVDGTSCTSPCTFQWSVGTNHTIATTSPQPGGGGKQYTFSSWSDGGALSHTILASSTPTTWVASFNETIATQSFSLTVSQPPSVAPGSTATATLSAAGINGFTGPIQLSYDPAALPLTMFVTFGTFELYPGGSTAIHVSTLNSVSTGTYTVPITGINGTLQQTAYITLVVSGSPAPPKDPPHAGCAAYATGTSQLTPNVSSSQITGYSVTEVNACAQYYGYYPGVFARLYKGEEEYPSKIDPQDGSVRIGDGRITAATSATSPDGDVYQLITEHWVQLDIVYAIAIDYYGNPVHRDPLGFSMLPIGGGHGGSGEAASEYYGTYYEYITFSDLIFLGITDVIESSSDPEPAITSVNPSSWQPGSTFNVVIDGTGFGAAPYLEISPSDNLQ
jgi:hypothetical protein